MPPHHGRIAADDGNGRIGRTLVHAMLRNADVTRRLTVPVSAGLLTRSGGGQRNRAWIAPEVLDALDAFAERVELRA